MKRLLLLFFLIAFLNNSKACSCGGELSFCENHTNYDFTGSFVVVDAFPFGISLKILNRFHGEENRDTITVWDLGGPYDICNDSSGFASASFLGAIGDTIILAISKIDTLKNSWDIVGDYRTPGFSCNSYKLRVTNNKVNGKIAGPEFTLNFDEILSIYNYDEFLIDFPSQRLNCENWLNNQELIDGKLLSYFPNPAKDNITITTESMGLITITNDIGEILERISIEKESIEISTQKLNSGVYFLSLQTDKSIATKKLIVH